MTEPLSAQLERLAEALDAVYCPARKRRLGDKPCPKCMANMSDECKPQAIAENAFGGFVYHNLPQIIAALKAKEAQDGE